MILRAAISTALADREAFTSKIAAIIEEQVGQDPEAAQKLSSTVTNAMESVGNSLMMEQFFKVNDTQVLEQKIDQLSAKVERLTSLIEKNGHD